MATMPMEATTTLKATSSACAGAMDDDDDDDSPSPFDGRALTAGGGYIKTIKSNSFFGTLYVVVAILQVFSPDSVRPSVPVSRQLQFGRVPVVAKSVALHCAGVVARSRAPSVSVSLVRDDDDSPDKQVFPFIFFLTQSKRELQGVAGISHMEYMGGEYIYGKGEALSSCSSSASASFGARRRLVSAEMMDEAAISGQEPRGLQQFL